MSDLSAEARRRLTKFVERVHRIRDSRYVKHWTEKGTGVKIRATQDGVQIIANFPDREATEALILNLRLFLQKSDFVSFHKLERLLEDPTVSDGWKERFIECKAGMDAWLDSYSGFIIDDTKYSFRELMNVPLFGDFAHITEKEAPLYDLWSSAPHYEIIEKTFHDCLHCVINGAAKVSHWSERELAGEEIPPLPR